MQVLHHPDFVFDQGGPVRGYDKVYGALLLSQLVFRLQLVDLISERAAVESYRDACRHILLHFKPLEVGDVILEAASISKHPVTLTLRLVLERDVEEQTCIVRHSILQDKTEVEDDCRLAVQRDVLGSKLLL